MISLPEVFVQIPLAHRGLHARAAGRIENSPAAVQAAAEAGYGVEVDVQLTADDEAVVFHDAELDRLTDATGPVRHRTLAELERIPLKDSTEGPRSLSHVLSILRGRVPALIELKDQSGAFGPEAETLAAAVAAAITGYSGPVAVMSFNPHTVQHLARLAPTVPRGLTTMDFSGTEGLSPEHAEILTNIDTFGAVGASFISHDRRSLDLPSVIRLRDRGIPVLTWTVRSPKDAQEAAHRADNITFEGFVPRLPQGQG